MNINATFGMSAFAPGQPHGLPDVVNMGPSATRIEAVAGASGSSGPRDPAFGDSGKQERNPPPSLLQIQINTLLREQAEKVQKEAEEAKRMEAARDAAQATARGADRPAEDQPRIVTLGDIDPAARETGKAENADEEPRIGGPARAEDGPARALPGETSGDPRTGAEIITLPRAQPVKTGQTEADTETRSPGVPASTTETAREAYKAARSVSTDSDSKSSVSVVILAQDPPPAPAPQKESADTTPA